MADREVIEAVLGSDIAIAGLVLVFAGFLLTKAESFRGSRAGDVYSWLAVAGLAPIVASLVAAWMCIDGASGGQVGSRTCTSYAKDSDRANGRLRHNFSCTHLLA